MSAPRLTIRAAVPGEESLVLRFIRDLAEYERLADQVVATPQDLHKALFGPRPYAEVVFGCLDERPVGFALFFHNFSTFLGKPGIYLEDLFVLPAARGAGVGKALLSHLARLTLERGGARLDWSVLDWNEPSIGFYRTLGAVPLDDWTVFRLSGPGLAQLAQAQGGPGRR
ncbi:MAG: GNAT family N-acetyltransferase [Proteobacteria bacterium]|nr:GNAT family N-acetyltransferase [Pseudomonadota bacterium]